MLTLFQHPSSASTIEIVLNNLPAPLAKNYLHREFLTPHHPAFVSLRQGRNFLRSQMFD